MSVQAAGIKVSIDGTQVWARSASASTTMSTEGVRALGSVIALGQVPSGPQETTANIEYYIAGEDPAYGIGNSIASDPTAHKGVEITIGAASFKGYLTSHSVTAEPDGLVTASASFVSFEPGINLKIGEGSSEVGPKDVAFAVGQGSSSGGNQSTSWSFEASFEWEPILLMGAEGVPSSEGYIFNGGQRSLTVRGVGDGGSVSYCLENSTANATAGAVCAGSTFSYNVAGKLTSAEVNAEIGGFAEGGFTVTEIL